MKRGLIEENCSGVGLIPNRYSLGEYGYGYQGSEKDNEVKGNGNSYTTHFRQLDPRLGRWLSIDPKASSLPWQSPYCSMDNNPIWYNDVKGDYTADGSLSKKEERKINRSHRKTGDANWKQNAEMEIASKVAENVEIIRQEMTKAKNLVESTPGGLEVFEKMTFSSSTKTADLRDEKYCDFFEETNRGATIRIDDLKTSGYTDENGKIFISNNIDSDFKRSMTILHEIIHYTHRTSRLERNNQGFTKLSINGVLIDKETQMEAINFFRNNQPNERKFVKYYTKQGVYDRNGNPQNIEAGYLFEYLFIINAYPSIFQIPSPR